MLAKRRPFERSTGTHKPLSFLTTFGGHPLANKKPGTAKRDTVSLGPLHAFFGGKLISEINPFLIEKYKQKRKEDRVSVRTINIELACLRHMFNMALKWGKA